VRTFSRLYQNVSPVIDPTRLRESFTLFFPFRQRPRITNTHATKRHTIQQGDTFFSLAEKNYGSHNLWTILADANAHLFWPLDLEPGEVITIPTDYRPFAVETKTIVSSTQQDQAFLFFGAKKIADKLLSPVASSSSLDASATPTTYSVSGIITFNTSNTVRVAGVDQNGAVSDSAVANSATGQYTLSLENGTYQIISWIDSSGTQVTPPPIQSSFAVIYPTIPLLVSRDLSQINLTLEEPEYSVTIDWSFPNATAGSYVHAAAVKAQGGMISHSSVATGGSGLGSLTLTVTADSYRFYVWSSTSPDVSGPIPGTSGDYTVYPSTSSYVYIGKDTSFTVHVSRSAQIKVNWSVAATPGSQVLVYVYNQDGAVVSFYAQPVATFSTFGEISFTLSAGVYSFVVVYDATGAYTSEEVPPSGLSWTYPTTPSLLPVQTGATITLTAVLS